MFLTKEYVLKRINRALKKSQAKIKADLKSARIELSKTPDSFYLPKKVKRLQKKLKGYAALEGIPFRPRKGVFEGAASYGGGWYRPKRDYATISCGFDFTTGRAHSYEWYDLGKIIRGQYVVNSYYYSSETFGHYRALIKTLKILGVKFIEMEAPKGLQDLNGAKEYHLRVIGQNTIELEHSKKDSYKKYRRERIKNAEKQLDMLSKIAGLKTSKKARIDAIDSARESRLRRLEIAKQDRDRDFKLAYERAIDLNDIRKIVQLTKQNQRRMSKGLPSLIANVS